MSVPINTFSSPEESQSVDSTSSDHVFVFPASYTQQRLWLLDQIEGKSAVYNMPSIWFLEGSLNVLALKQAISEIIRRHEVLRTNFQMLEDQAVQVIAESVSFELPIWELSGLIDPVKLSPEIEQLIREETKRPFDLAHDLLLRGKLLRFGSEQHILLLTMHHIVSDAWSIGIFRQELGELYEAFSLGKSSPLESLAIQYADFAHWQQELLSGAKLKSHLDYWRQNLKDVPPLLELPTDYPRPAVQTFRGDVQSLTVSAEITHKLKALSNQHQSTLFMTLLAAFSVLLHRYSGQQDIAIGSPIANRQRQELEKLIGCFVNTLVLRTQLTPQTTFVEVLEQVRQTALDAYAHQDLPFEKLVEELQPERSLSHSPLFQVMFILQNTPRSRQKLSDLKITPLRQRRKVAKFDLTLIMAEVSKQGELTGRLEYNSDLFEAATITRMIQHWQTLLEGIVSDPEQSITDLPLLSQEERQRILVEWNQTRNDFSPQCIHELFEAQVTHAPDAIAVVLESKATEVSDRHKSSSLRQLTYRELNHQANLLADYLIDQGLGTGSLVGIAMERSLEMLVALLGILKSGAAYVPLDPSYPEKRLAFMVSDAQIECLITQQHLTPLFEDQVSKVICLDQDWSIIAQTSSSATTQQRESIEVKPDHLAYVIYTSGSTGTPKGVAISHRSVTNCLQSFAHQPGLSAQDKFLSVTTLSFDIAVLELFLPLTVGAQVVLVGNEVARDGTQLKSILEKSGITAMQGTPSTWQMLLTAGWQGTPSLTMLCGGEALTQDLAQQLLKRGKSLWNLYGPTEATIWSTIRQIKADCKTITIGKPIANTQIYILDTSGNPVPVGVPGEIHLAGSGLAQGYLNRPELTSQKFIDNHLFEDHGDFSKAEALCDRLYKTGDLARYLPNGSIEYLGRIDHQVKLRGFRIELGEIESVLAQHSGLKSSVVTLREDRIGDKRLVAYSVAASMPAPSSESLGQFLAQKLPHYMVPSAFVILDQFPLTPNGKVDRLALPIPNWQENQAETNKIKPRNLIEQQIAEIWQTVLGVSSVSINDNFFALGGHSLLAAQVVSRLRSQFAGEITLRHIFETKTLAALVELIQELQGQEQDLSPPLTAIPRSSRRRPQT